MKAFYDPTAEHLDRLSGPWCCSFSGGKDSSSLVVWIEWLRRAGWITVERPHLVRSDTGVEEPGLTGIAEELTALLEACGWECGLVRPAIHERLYNRILGIGNTPIHPGINKMRWCTRSTKIDPMERWKEMAAAPLWITGLRLGESKMRDGKIKVGCAAGGECGIPEMSERTYSPLLNWTTCNVIDWLNGAVRKSVRDMMADAFEVTRKLVAIYGVSIGQPTFEFADPDVKAMRFGCIGCPAIGADAAPPNSVIRRNGKASPLNELYAVWFEARRPANRCWKPEKRLPGPIRLSVRPVLFERVMDIQRRSGVTLITPEDEAFIRDCWEKKVYPRGWSEADEVNKPPMEPLFLEGV